jgi:hypothetical protein
VGDEVYHETLDSDSKVIMSNPDYKLPKTEDMNISRYLPQETAKVKELSQKGHTLQDMDMLMKGRAVNKYLDAQKLKEPGLDTGVKMHERSGFNDISNVMRNLYLRNDDVFRMSIDEWIKKIPEYFASGGHVPGFATGGVSNLFRERQGYSRGKLVKDLPAFIKFVEQLFIKASNQIRRGQGLFKKLTEKQRIVQHNNLTTLAEEFNKTKTFDPKVNEYFGINAEKAFVEAQTKQGEQMWKDIGAAPTFKLSREKLVDQFKGLPETEVNRIMKLPVEEQKLEITRLNELSDHAWIKGKPHAEGGLIPGYATGGVSELFNEKTPREGFHRGSLRHQKQHDYEALEKKGNIFRYLMMAGDRAKRAAPENPVNVFFSKKDEKGNPLWSYNQKTDDFESFMKERFMYGEHKEPIIGLGKSELDKKINNWVKEKFLKLVGKEDVPEEFATGGVSNLFRKK